MMMLRENEATDKTGVQPAIQEEVIEVPLAQSGEDLEIGRANPRAQPSWSK